MLFYCVAAAPQTFDAEVSPELLFGVKTGPGEGSLSGDVCFDIS